MKIVLLYPPPWKLAEKGGPAAPAGEGPPADYKEGDLDADFYQIPYGLLALGAAALRAGHQVKVLNLSSYAWSRVEDVVSRLDADLWGMSMWTANRRGVALVAQAIKQRHPRAHVVVGGPHATPLAREILTHHPAIDTVCVGESDLTFLELAARIENGGSVKGIAGTYYRDGERVLKGPDRASVEDLDSLASPHDYFDTHILMTSRGCPWSCTFCGAETSWGRGFRGASVDYVLRALERSVARLPVKLVQIKDDTFTTNKKRVIELCRAIREKGLSFFWSCDTRVDLLTEPLLREMRLAGCQRLSLGVESGSQRILDAIEKKITVDEIIQSTELARSVGIEVRYYMMLGNRGDTAETFRETLDFLARARPNQYIFSCLSIYPGTKDFHDAEQAGWLEREAYFTGDFQELKTPFDASAEDMALMNEWFSRNSGLRELYRPTVADTRRVLANLGDYHAAHMDVAAACYREGQWDEAERHVLRAMELGYPVPGVAENYLACIAKERGDLDGLMSHLSEAARRDPQHWVLIRNVNAARAWFKERGPERGLPLELVARHDFQLLERTVQPTLPGPLPEGWETWDPPRAAEPDATWAKTPDVEGSVHELRGRRKLDVLP
jgi:anaerobic magnesium-protoporphyrin IX monomethyl ester cyclase